ncbi:hypothetical protein [Nocardia suismassiliense]|uniref:hypothetical protein n=1 Tax=Nocardia suismassiliense TaxID=2077092 RepID=UPI00131F0E45|nr:hypothetical protein [Nocardia suismassiliense]
MSTPIPPTGGGIHINISGNGNSGNGNSGGSGSGSGPNWQKIGAIAGIIGVIIAVVVAYLQFRPTPESTTSAPPTGAIGVSSTRVPVTTSTASSAAPAGVDPPSKGGAAIAHFKFEDPQWWGMSFLDWKGVPMGPQTHYALHGKLGLSAENGVRFAHAPTTGDSHPSYSACEAAHYDILTVPLNKMPSGTFLCVRTQMQKFGWMQLTWTPSKDDPSFTNAIQSTGAIWNL